MATEGQKPANEIQLLSPLAELKVRSLGEIRTLERTKASRVEVTGVWRTATDRAETFLGFVFLLGTCSWCAAGSGQRCRVSYKHKEQV